MRSKLRQHHNTLLTSWLWPRLGNYLTHHSTLIALGIRSRGGRSCCCSSDLRLRFPSCRFTLGLPDAHVELDADFRLILAGVVAQDGWHGILRICYPICPLALRIVGYGLHHCVVSMVYGAFAALAQKDFKRMVAYSSVSHMGYVTLGLVV